MIKTKSILRYDPVRGKNTRRVKWWCVLDLPRKDQLAEYAIWHLDRNWWELDNSPIKRNYVKPGWNTHISLIRGEEPRKNKHLWGKYLANQWFDISYELNIRQATSALASKDPEGFWFIPAFWDRYLQFRDHFGLPTSWNGRPHKLHITVARIDATR